MKKLFLSVVMASLAAGQSSHANCELASKKLTHLKNLLSTIEQGQSTLRPELLNAISEGNSIWAKELLPKVLHNQEELGYTKNAIFSAELAVIRECQGNDK